jgi:uncharacterized phage protein gp47/JayE
MAKPPLAARTRDQIRTDILRTMTYGYRSRGVSSPNTGYGSDDYVWAQAAATEIEPTYANTQAAADAQMPDTSSDTDLDRLLGVVGLARRAAGPSTGYIQPQPTNASSMPTGAQLTDPNGNPFQVVTGGTAASSVPYTIFTIQSVGVGTATNLPAGTVMKWVNPPPYMAGTLTLYGAASGGVDAETDDAARQRLLAYYSSVQTGGGAWGQVQSLAQSSSPEIAAAFVYPAANGPGTEHVAVMGYWKATNYNPVVSTQSVNLAISAVQNQLPEYVESVITTVQATPADLAFQLLLPAALNAIPAGTGGGWVDASPFPMVRTVAGTAATNQRCRVLTVTTSTSLVIESMVAGAIGQSISWIDKSTFSLVTAKVVTITETLAPSGSTMGQYTITIDTPFVGAGASPGTVQVNDYVFPACANQANYLAAVLATFASSGPGEKLSSAVAGLLPRAYRQPRPTVAWGYALDGRFTAALTNAGSEVQQATYCWQNGTPSAQPPTPPQPATISAGPYVWTPRLVAFYPA